MNTLLKLLDYGQSYWLDNLTRGKIAGGELKERVERQGLRGITSNPSIFHKAISESRDYDAQIKSLVDQKTPIHKIYEALTVKDVRDACDVLRPVFEKSGEDGFVSLEVSPYLAHDTAGSIEEARRLFKAVDRPNCFIKIPGTLEGIPAIEEMLYEGVNINITLLFSIQSYEAVAYAYIKALERRLAENKPVDEIASVASFFLSRIDVLADQLLSQHIIAGAENSTASLLGEVANANAKLAYQSFKRIFSGERWQKLSDMGAKVQRPLWASTSTKNPLYRDVRYVEPLIGKNTVNTLPDKTIEAFSDHGILRENTVEEGLDHARSVFKALKKTPVELDFITRQLTNEGIEKFIQPYNALLALLARKRQTLLGDQHPVQEVSYGALETDIKAALDALDEKQFSRRLYAGDPGLWPHAGGAEAITNRLGWVDGTREFLDKINGIKTWAADIRREGFKQVILLGMGGSSLSTEAAFRFFGHREGYPEMTVLDNTHPGVVHHAAVQADLAKTLFIVASKSGTTIETLSLYAYFHGLLQKQGIADAGSHFTAITDEGSPLVKEASEKKFRCIFENPGNYGGRYSALSYFGLVPMALMGADIQGIMENARQMAISCGPCVPSAANPATLLGAFLGIAQRHGRNKVTLLLPDTLSGFGRWLEQLLAESTGKQGSGLIPVAGETAGAPEDYGDDRIFIHITLGGDEPDWLKKRHALQEAGYPVVQITIRDRNALGGEFLRWQFATAVAGTVMGINPFDEPNVAESKRNTGELLGKYEKERSFGTPEPLFKDDGIHIYAAKDAVWLPEGPVLSVSELLETFLKAVRTGDYIALLPFFQPSSQRNERLQALRIHIRNTFKCATSTDYGPRYLHSTGQLHKGGPDSGVFLMFTAGMQEQIGIPGKNYNFNHIHEAKCLGDLRALENKKRRIVRIHFEQDIDAGLEKINQIISSI